MRILVDTERPNQSALDRAVASLLTEGAARGGLQQCEECRDWAITNDLEYICQAILVTDQAGSPDSLKIQLKTRYSHFRCPEGCAKQPKHPDHGEQEHQLSPVHVQAVYTINGGNVNTITKGFIVVCPECGDESPVLDSQQAVQQHIQDHLGSSPTAAAAAAAADNSGHPCPQLAACFNQGVYSNPAAFGTTVANLGDQSASPAAAAACPPAAAAAAAAPERLYKQLLARITACCAVHILSATRPPNGAAAASNADSDASSSSSSASDLLTELLPWRSWAASCLIQNPDLLHYANWPRPMLQPRRSDQEVSLLDLMFAPPLIAVSGPEAGCCAHKLAAVLKRLRQRHFGYRTVRQKRHGGEAAAARSSKRNRSANADTAAAAAIICIDDDDDDKNVGDDDSIFPAADTAAAATAGTSAADQLLSELLSTDSVFKHYPPQQRVPEFLQQAAVSSEDLAAAMTSKVVDSHLKLCGGCGRNNKQLAKGVQLHRCSNCVACICAECKNTDPNEESAAPQAAAAAAAPPPAAAAAAAAAADKERVMCRWCTVHCNTAAAAEMPGNHEQQRHAAAADTGPQQQQQQQCALPEADDLERYLNSGLRKLMFKPTLTDAARMVLAAMQQKKRQLLLNSTTQAPAATAAAGGDTHVGQPLAQHTLQVLRKVVSNLLQLPDDVSRNSLLECLGVGCLPGAIPAAAAAAAAAAAGSSGLAGSSKSTTVLDQLIDCWAQEERLTGRSVQQAIAAADCAVAIAAAATAAVAAAAPAPAATRTVEPSSSSPEAQSFLSGLSCMVLQLLTRCCAAAAAAAACMRANSNIGLSELQQLAQQLIKGTTVLLVSTPAAAATDDDAGWLDQAAFWRTSVWCSLQRLQEGAGEGRGAEQLTAVFSEIEGQMQELQRHSSAV